MKKRNIWIALIIAAILSVLIYVPAIPVPPSPCLPFGDCIPAHTFYSVTMKFLNFGTQYNGPSIITQYYGHPVYSQARLDFCLVKSVTTFDCGPTLSDFGALLWADLLVAIAAIDVALLVSFILTRKGLTGALSQLGFGVLAVISPALSSFLGILALYSPLSLYCCLLFPMSLFVLEEITLAGAVLVLTAIAEIWWFGRKQHQSASQPREFDMESSSMPE